MKEINTYVIETTNAFVILAVLDQGKWRPYYAKYMGTPRIAGCAEIDRSKPLSEEFAGQLEGPYFDALLAACQREITERAGEIISIEEASNGNKG